MKEPTVQVAFTAKMEDDGVVVYDHKVADDSMMEWAGWRWDGDIEEFLPDLVPMCSDLTLLSNPDLPEERAEQILRDFMDYIIKHRREAVAMAKAKRRELRGR